MKSLTDNNRDNSRLPSKHRIFVLLFLTFFTLTVLWMLDAFCGNNGRGDVSQLKVPDGFEISVWAEEVENARAMCLGDEGTLFVGSRKAGKIYALPDKDGNHEPDEVIVIAEGFQMPVGVAFRDGDLYFSATSKIYCFRDIESKLDDPGKPELISDAFPTETHHGWKFIDFGPDDKLYVPVGAPCNICNEDPDQFANIMRMNPDGTNLETYARGVRNTVGFDWHPETKELWFTDNGRDWMGDDLPPCELNKAANSDMHFGYPFCHGGDIQDPEYGEDVDCSKYARPEYNFGAHTAPLGMCFYDGEALPEKYQGNIFVALHGSWNRSTKIGYQVLSISLSESGEVEKSSVFIDGFERNGEVFGRPVDVLVYKDGSLLISDDHSDKIYRVSFEGS